MATTSTASSSEQTSTTTKRALSDVLSETFPPFDHRAKVVSPFEQEVKRDTEFVESAYMLGVLVSNAG